MELTHFAERGGVLSSFLKGELAMSSGLINRLKWGDGIRVNGDPVHTNHLVRAGDVITISMEEEMPEYPAEDGDLNILYEDEYLLAVDKPAGMLIHPSHSQFGGTLANFVQGYYCRSGQRCAFHPLTRLDRDTFGIVLLAKNSHIHARLQAEKSHKIYNALVYGAPREERGAVDAPIARKPMPSLLREISLLGKPCRTEYRVLERKEEVSLLELYPITGRTHQLRLHCMHMGCPIVGDPQYNSLQSKMYSDGMGVTTQLLCAKRLEFTHPITGKPMVLESKMSISQDLLDVKYHAAWTNVFFVKLHKRK